MTLPEPAGKLLPRGWHAISLQPPSERARTIQSLVGRQFEGSGASAELRRQVQQALFAVCADAARAGGVIMAFDVSRRDAGALPVSLTVFRPGAGLTMERVKEGHAATPSAVTAHGLCGQIVRTESVGNSPSVEGAPPLPQLRVEYWLDPDDGRGVYHAVFSTSLVAFRDPLVELFDTMVSSVSARRDELEDQEPIQGVGTVGT